MSGDDSANEHSGIELSRRTFTKAAGAAAGAGLLGASANTAAADHTNNTMAAKFANPRVQELEKVWSERGYRGSGVTLGINDSGIDARHPDLGPWNGVQIVPDGDSLRYLNPDDVEYDRLGENDFEESATVSPGATGTGQESTIHSFTPSSPRNHIDAEMSWTPAQNDLEFRLDERDGDGGWTTVKRVATASNPEVMEQVPVESGVEHRFVAESYANAGSEATVTGTVYERRLVSGMSGDADLDIEDPLAYTDSDVSRQPKTVGWFDAGSRYGSFDRPRDTNGHGSHVASITAGSGRASQIAREVEGEEFEDGREVLLANAIYVDVFLEEGEGGVYASAYGDTIEIEINERGGFGDPVASSTITSDASTNDNNTTSTPASEGEAYTVTIRGASNSNTDSVAQGVNARGTVDSYSVGTFTTPDTAGDRDYDARDDPADDQVALHSGVAPDASLVGFQGLSGPLPTLGEHADQLVSDYNMRAVNMSWGPVGGVPIGVAGGTLDTGGILNDIRRMADDGVLAVAAAGNAATPANGNGYPAVADEAISVVATGPKDGISGYSSGGIGAVDEDENTTYMKPDVTAPGGTLADLAKAAEADTANPDDDDSQPTDYTGKSGTSMASPYTCGVTGLVAEAMLDTDLEGKDGSLIRSLDGDEAPDMNDTLRLKQVILATATETAFTAAPYHRAKAPTYRGGDRDPFEGYGRINPDAAVDAVTANIYSDGESLADSPPGETEKPLTSDYGGTVGLDVPQDNRAVAGFVDAPRGQLELLVSTQNFRGNDVSMATGQPQVDVFVYDAENPGANGEPNIVTQGRIDATTSPDTTRRGSITLSVDTGDRYDITWTGDGVETRKLLVVAKLVNVPGLVNGFDARTDVTFEASFTPEFEPLPGISVQGGRKDSGDRFTPGTRNTVQVTLDSTEVTEGRICDRVPKDWGTPVGDPGDDRTDYEGIVRETETHRIIDLGDFDADPDTDAAAPPTSRSYVISAPNTNGSYTFGPARIQVEDEDADQRGVQAPTDDGEDSFSDNEATFGGSDPRNVVVGGTEMSGSSSTTDTDSATDTVDDATSGDDGSATDTVGDTVDDKL